MDRESLQYQFPETLNQQKRLAGLPTEEAVLIIACGVTAALQQQQNKTAGLERDLGTLTGTLKSQNEELKKQLTTMAEAISQLQTQQVQGGRTPNGPATSTPAAGSPPASAPVSSGQSGPAQWSINNPGSGPAAGQGGQFYPSQGQGFYPGTGTVRPGGLSRDTFTYAALTDKKMKLPWIPSGSFSEAVIIEGADANASVPLRRIVRSLPAMAAPCR